MLAGGAGARPIDLSSLSGDDEVFRAVIAEIQNQLGRSQTVENPANKKEDLNRLSDEASDAFLAKLGELLAIADKALSATSKKLSAETWSDAFGHFFPVLEVDEEIKQLKAESRALFPTFDPIVAVRAVGGGKSFQGTNKIGPFPKGAKSASPWKILQRCSGASVHWMVRNSGREAEQANDLGHRAGEGTTVSRDSVTVATTSWTLPSSGTDC